MAAEVFPHKPKKKEWEPKKKKLKGLKNIV